MMRGTGLTVVGVAGAAAGVALGQLGDPDGTAVIGIDAPESYTTGEAFTIAVTIDYFNAPEYVLGVAGWNFELEVIGGTITSVEYMTALTPLADLTDPFFGDPAPTFTASTAFFHEGLFFLSSPRGYHLGGTMALVTIDPTEGRRVAVQTQAGASDLMPNLFDSSSVLFAGSTGIPIEGPWLFDAGETVFGSATVVPAPGSSAALALAGVLAGRRQRRRKNA